MRVLGVLAAWTVLAVLATLCFAVGGSIGYRRGVQDAVQQLRERRSGKTGCRPVPLSHHRHRPVTRSLRSAADPLRARMRRPAYTAHGEPPRMRVFAGVRWSPAAIGAAVAVFVLAVPGFALGASTAQPGERLWGVKRGLENVQLAMALGADDEVEVHVDLAGRRLSELDQLLGSTQADPQVVDVVIQGLHDHTEDATARLNDVERGDRAALAASLDDVVARQVAVIDLLIDIDCTDSTDDQCVALGDTRKVSVELHETTSASAGDPGSVAVPTDVAVSPPAGAAATEPAMAVTASAEASEPASEGSGADAASTASPPSDTSGPQPDDPTSAPTPVAEDPEDGTDPSGDTASPDSSTPTVSDPTGEEPDSAESTTGESAEQSDADDDTLP
jgi:hypothetical protein